MLLNQTSDNLSSELIFKIFAARLGLVFSNSAQLHMLSGSTAVATFALANLS